MKYIIEQWAGYQYEPIHNEPYDREVDAEYALMELEFDLGWKGLRVNICPEDSVLLDAN